jgi:hypothetical protein
MPYRLPKLIRNIVESDNPADVLNALDEQVRPLHLQSIWHAPDDVNVDRKDILFHESVPPRFVVEHDAALKIYGATRVAQLVLKSPLPLTNSELRHQLNPIGRDQWMFDIRQDHGMRDTFAVNLNRSVVCYWSNRILDCDLRRA